MRVQLLTPDGGPTSFTVVDASGLPIEVIDGYLGYLTARNSSPNTVRAYAYDLRDFWVFLSQRGQAHYDVGLEDLAAWMAWVRVPAPFRASNIIPISVEPRLADSTVARKLSAVVAFYEYIGLHDDRVAPLLSRLRQGRPRGSGPYQAFLSHIGTQRSGSSRTITVKVPKRCPKVLSPRQVQDVMNACSNRRDRLFFATLWESGLRASEALGLRIDDLDERGGSIRVTPRTNLNGARVKGSKERVIPVGTRFVRLAIDYLTLDYGAVNSDYLFVNLYGGAIGAPWTYVSVDDLVRRIRKRVGFFFTPHMFRHTYSNRLLQAGARIEIVAELLGHADIQTTRSIYGHLGVADLRAELDRVGWLDSSEVLL
jgi:integrase/recombinase XerD